MLSYPGNVLSKGPLQPETVSEIFRQFFPVCDSMLFILNLQGRIELLNNAAFCNLGYGEDDLAGVSFSSLLDDSCRDRVQGLMDEDFSDALELKSALLLKKNGNRIPVDLKITRGTVQGNDVFFVSGKDVTRLKTSEEMFFKAFHSSSVIMVVFTLENGRIVDANESAFKLTGFSAEEMIGKTIADLNLYPDKDQRLTIQQLIIEKGYIRNQELTVRTQRGDLRYVLFSMDALSLDDETCVLAVGSDFTQRKQAEEALKKAYVEQGRQKKIIENKSRELEKAKKLIEKEAKLVEESSQHKSEFLASMSHELRTPLNSIILLSDLLSRNLDGHLSEKESEYAEIINAAGKDLLGLINDVLDISRVEAGRMEINLSRVSMEYFIRKIRGYFTEMAAVKGLAFGVYSQSGLTDFFISDIQKVEQIIKNLLSNAIKFTENGSVNLYIKRPEPDCDLSGIGLEGLDPEKTLAFSVVDTGIGIPEEKRDVVFEVFRQADKSILKKYGGTGLGLPVSKVLSQLLGGDLQIKSVYGKGSTFTLYLPEHQPETSDHPGEGQTPVAVRADRGVLIDRVGDRLEGKTIVIADDDMRTVYSLMQNLEAYKPQIVVASNGKSCLEKLEENPDTVLLLLDITMPEMDGFDVLRTLRVDERFTSLPTIVITANAMSEDRDMCLLEGADAYIPKPLDLNHLLSAMADLI